MGTLAHKTSVPREPWPITILCQGNLGPERGDGSCPEERTGWSKDPPQGGDGSRERATRQVRARGKCLDSKAAHQTPERLRGTQRLGGGRGLLSTGGIGGGGLLESQRSLSAGD